MRNQNNQDSGEQLNSMTPKAAPKEISLKKEKPKEESESYSFGQSAGLKDDLDVEDNDIG